MYNSFIMKSNIHPQYYDQAQVVCVCGNRFNVGSTQQNIQVELCYNCHPFYTGEERFVDKGSVIDRFQKKREQAQQYQATQKKKVEDKVKKSEAPKTLREMLMGAR